MASTTDIATRRGEHDDAASDADDRLLGVVLDDRYQILRRLGAGGMGAVYEAENLRLGRRIAVKVLQSSLSSSEKYRKRFLREAKAASSIPSPYIVRALDFGSTQEDLLYFTMELLEGDDLEQYLRQRSPLPWSELAPIMHQILHAVGAAHRHGIIHRDIKPSNCFLCSETDGVRRVKVLDFGIAKVSATSLEGNNPIATVETLTGTNEMFGTVAYMAPELVDGHPADARSDIYALGVLLFRALTGALPFSGANAYKVLQQHVHTPVPSLRARAPDVSAAVESVVFRALAKRPEHRYQSVEELTVALEAASRGVLEPSGAALAGFTAAVRREPAVPGTEPGASGGGTHSSEPFVSQRIEDPGTLRASPVPTSRVWPLVLLGLVLLVSGATAALVGWLVRAPSTEPVVAVSARPQEQPSARADAEPPGPQATPTASPVHLEPPEPEPVVVPATEATAPAADPASPPATEVASGKRSSSSARDPAPKAVTLEALAGRRCPDAVGERFTVVGLLDSGGKYLDAEVSGGTKATRDCIKELVQTRRFGKGKPMRPKTLVLVPS